VAPSESSISAKQRAPEGTLCSSMTSCGDV
jgi:hypothetical protein